MDFRNRGLSSEDFEIADHFSNRKLNISHPARYFGQPTTETFVDVFAQLKTGFESVAMGKVSTSAFEARALKLARDADPIAFNAFELLHVAKQQALSMAESGYRPPLPARRIQVAGDVGIATFKMMLVNMLEGRFISPHDFEIATRIATVLCGGEVDRGALVDEDWLLRLEREHFVALAQMPKTQERIAHMLKTGKPLRN